MTANSAPPSVEAIDAALRERVRLRQMLRAASATVTIQLRGVCAFTGDDGCDETANRLLDARLEAMAAAERRARTIAAICKVASRTDV